MKRPARETLVKYFKGQAAQHELEPIQWYLALGIDELYIEECLREAFQQIAPYTSDNPSNDDFLEFQDRFLKKQLILETEEMYLNNEITEETGSLSRWIKLVEYLPFILAKNLNGHSGCYSVTVYDQRILVARANAGRCYTNRNNSSVARTRACNIDFSRWALD